MYVWFFFTIDPIYLTIWTGSIPVVRQMIIHFFPVLSNCKILAGHSVYQILTSSIIHFQNHGIVYVKYNRISAEASVSSYKKKNHKTVKEGIITML